MLVCAILIATKVRVIKTHLISLLNPPGYCPDGACGHTSVPLATPTVSPFDPNACTGGQSLPLYPGYLGICSYS
jgi:hypothetical protein